MRYPIQLPHGVPSFIILPVLQQQQHAKFPARHPGPYTFNQFSSPHGRAGCSHVYLHVAKHEQHFRTTVLNSL